MQFLSLAFLGFVALSLAGFHLATSLRAKRGVLLVSNLIFATAIASSPSTMLPMALFLGAAFCAVRVTQAVRRRSVATIAVLMLVAAFAYLKQYTRLLSLPVPTAPYSVIGLSYVLFRVLHLTVDGFEGAVSEPVSPLAFVNYCTFFPVWLSGPIQRYDSYREQERQAASRRPSGTEVAAAFGRIVAGVFKIGILSAVLFDWHGQCAALPLDVAHRLHAGVTLAAAATLYTLYMYYNFAGYMDVALGVGALYGFRLPENFDRPFAAQNLLEFWSRWHITLSDWFRTYLFNPLLRATAARWGTPRSTPYLGVAAYLVTFSVMGIWHGSTAIFLVYGLLLGVGVSGNKLYEIEARKWLGKDRFRRLRANRPYARLCQGSVFAYFSAALVCFWAPPPLRRQIVAVPLAAMAGYVGLTVTAAVVLTAASLARAAWNAAPRRWHATLARAPFRQALLGVGAYAVVLLLLLKWTTVPAFVYVPF